MSVIDRSPSVVPALAVRRLTGIRFPVFVFILWRLVQAAVVVLLGGSLRTVNYAWDGGWYLDLLRSGYTVPGAGYTRYSDAAFFPGLSWATRAVELVVPSDAAATLLVSNALALAAFVTAWGAARAWVDEALARRVTVALALFPTSFFLWAYFTEGLLIAATAAAVWAARRERHVLAAGLLALASSARLVGITVGPALAVARIVRTRRVDAVSVGYVLGSLLGLGAVMAQQAAQIHDPFGWLHAGRAWHRGLGGPWMPLDHAVHLLLLPASGSAVAGILIDLSAIAGVFVLLVLLWRATRRAGWPLEAAAVATPLWLVPVCSTLVDSQARYMLACWPVLLVVADLWPRLPRPLRIVAVVVCVAATVLLLRALAVGGFAG